MTYLAVPIAGETIEDAAGQMREAVAAGAELLELRTDYLAELDVVHAASLITTARRMGGSLPLIVTCRDKKQGGARNYPAKLRIEVLLAAVKQGVEYIDCEYENFVPTENQEHIRAALARNPGTRLILSVHDFQTRFRDIEKLYRDISNVCPGAIPKLVYTANHINDCFEAIDLLHKKTDPRIVLCMGKAGAIVRLLAKKLGSAVSFASIGGNLATAPGQFSVEQMKQVYRYDSVDAETELFGVIASPVGHSLSPAVHNASLSAAKFNGLYLPLLVQGRQREFDLFMRNVLHRKWLGFKGFSVTIPHKHNALEFVRRQGGDIEPLAERIGAANTVVITGDHTLKAYNTDYAGALDAITESMGISRSELSGLPVAVVGAGGVSRAIVAGLADAGAHITIYNRTVDRGEKLAGEFGAEAFPLDALAGLDAKLLVNCTSIGMHPDVDASPVPQEYLDKDMTVFDTVYNPVRTLLIKQAELVGARTVDGVSMFVNQAMTQFRLFTGRDGDPELMRRTMLEHLQ